MGACGEVYLGVYVVVERKKIQKTKDVFGCKDHKDEIFNGDYCPECGEKRTTWSETESVYPSMYDMIDELDIKEDTFFIAWDESDDNSSEILLPNTGDGSLDDGKSLQLEILPTMPDLSIDTFRKSYSEELAKLKTDTKYIKSCTVKFGIVQYFN